MRRAATRNPIAPIAACATDDMLGMGALNLRMLAAHGYAVYHMTEFALSAGKSACGHTILKLWSIVRWEGSHAVPCLSPCM